MGVDLPKADTVFALRTVIVSLVLGTGITLLATIVPARRATRVPPIAAVREGSTLPASRFSAHSHKTGLAVVLASFAAIAVGIFGGLGGLRHRAAAPASACIGLFLGIALLAPRLVKPLAHLVGWPARRAGGVAGELAGANAVRNPSRTASTAAALMIGLTLVTVVAVLGAAMNKSTKSAVSDQLRAGYVVDGNGQVPFSAAEGDELAAVPGVKAASHVRSDKALVKGEEIDVTGIDPATIADFYRFEWTKGSDETARPARDGWGARDEELRRRQRPRGRRPARDPVALGREAHGRRARDLRPARGEARCSRTSASSRRRSTTRSRARRTPSRSSTPTRAPPRRSRRRRRTRAARPCTRGPRTRRTRRSRWRRSWRCSTCCSASRSIVSLFGMVNTLVLSVFERTRELGMLRAIGMTRRQARRMIRHESVITALIGAALGLGLGILLAVGGSPGAVEVRRRHVAAAGDAGRLHAGRDPRRHRRGDPPRTAGLAAQRARRAPLRVAGGHDDDRDPHAVRDPCRPAAHAAGRPDSRDPHLPDRARPDRAARARRQLRAAAAGHVARRPSRQRPRAARRARPRGVGVPAPARRPPRRPVAVPRRARHRRRRRGDPLHARRSAHPATTSPACSRSPPACCCSASAPPRCGARGGPTAASVWRYPRRALLGVAGVSSRCCSCSRSCSATSPRTWGAPSCRTNELGVAYENVKFETSDGLELEGWYVPSKNGAAVIAFPGRNGPQKQTRMLARHGYGVLLFDRRGEGKSEGDPHAFGWGGEKDIKAAIAYLPAPARRRPRPHRRHRPLRRRRDDAPDRRRDRRPGSRRVRGRGTRAR